MKKHIPNFITILNLLLGCLAIVFLFEGEYLYVFITIFIAGWLDVGDGLAARLLGVYSDLGKELDSLADMVSFGVVPGTIMFLLIDQSLPESDSFHPLALIGFLVTAFSCLRLAKFNIDTRQTDYFLGVPTPANTACTVGLMMVYAANEPLLGILNNTWILIGVSLVLSYLLVAEIPMFSLKMKNFKWKGNEVRFIYFPLAIALIIGLGWSAFPIGFVLYVIASILDRMIFQKS